ncbi:MAG: hypothetical protein ACRD1I_09325 [Terriglobia bacterium]
MKKPIWMRLVGWASLVLWALAGWGLYSYSHGYPTTASALVIFLFMFLAGALGIVWIICSALTWAITRQARVGAAVMRDSMAGLTPPPAPHVRAGQGDGLPRWAGKSAVTSCYHCAQPAVLHCCRHEANLCWQHLLTHDSDECTYIRAERVVRQAASAAEAPRRTATSPIGGIR